jgi:hypothetical protein
MTNSPKADAWLRDYQVPWGFQAPGGTNTESLHQSIVSTNGAATESRVRLQALPTPFYQVIRVGGVDFAARPGVFRLITSPDDYHFLLASGWISVPHGSAAAIELNLLQYIRNEASLTGGGKIEAIPGSIKEIAVRAESVEDTHAACPYCRAEDETAAVARAQGITTLGGV